MIGVELRAQAVPVGRLEDRSGFFDGKGRLLYKHVAEPGQARLGDLRDEVFAQEPEVVVPAVFEFGRNDVRPEERRDNAEGLLGV